MISAYTSSLTDSNPVRTSTIKDYYGSKGCMRVNIGDAYYIYDNSVLDWVEVESPTPTPVPVRLSRSGIVNTSQQIHIGSNGDQILVGSQFYLESNRVEQLQFASGTVWDLTSLSI